MGYRIELVRPEAGLTALQTIEWLNAQFDAEALDSTPPATWTHDQQACWERICVQVESLARDTERATFPTHFEIATQSPRVRLEYTGHDAVISVPYSYSGGDVQRAMHLAYAIGRAVEAETGLVGVDAQTTAGLADAHVHRAVAAYLGP